VHPVETSTDASHHRGADSPKELAHDAKYVVGSTERADWRARVFPNYPSPLSEAYRLADASKTDVKLSER